jgi:hypothetical protein
VQGTTDLHDHIAETGLPQPEPIFHHATPLHTAVDMLNTAPAMMEARIGHLVLQSAFLTTGFLGRHAHLHLGEGKREETQILQQSTANR